MNCSSNHLKYLVIVIVFSLTLLTSFRPIGAQQIDCARFRTGSFMMRSEQMPGLIFYMDRNDSVQTEKVWETEIVVRTKVEWLGSCEYRLSFLSANEAGRAALAGVDHKPVTMKIIKTTAKYYIFEARSEGIDDVLIDTLVKLK